MGSHPLSGIPDGRPPAGSHPMFGSKRGHLRADTLPLSDSSIPANNCRGSSEKTSARLTVKLGYECLVGAPRVSTFVPNCCSIAVSQISLVSPLKSVTLTSLPPSTPSSPPANSASRSPPGDYSLRDPRRSPWGHPHCDVLNAAEGVIFLSVKY